MTTAVQRRRGTNTEHASFTGLEGEISVNTTNESVHVHDGSTAGGFELMRADGSNSSVSLGDITGVTAGTGLSGGGTSGDVTLNIDGTVATLAGTQTFTNKTLTSPILNTPTIGTSFTIGGATITEAELEILDGATVTTTELNYVDGVTSSIQTQIDAKAPIASPTFTGTVTIPTADINAGSIDGTAIGASSASTGAFTTLTATGLTVDTDTLYVDSTNNRVGIGTTSPDTLMHLSANTGATLTLESTDTAIATNEAIGTIDFFSNDASGIGAASRGSISLIAQDAAGAGSMLFKTSNASSASTERMRIDSSGNVGIASGRLRVASGDDEGTQLNAWTTAGGDGNLAAFNLVFNTGSNSARTERMRIDSSGNLLVGKTSASSATVGTQIEASGAIAVTRDGSTPLYLNRKTSDGAITEFRKDGSTVGSIRSISGDSIGIGNGDAGLRFVSSTNRIQPVDMDNGLNSDALTSLGDTNKRFKDLYLSGGVYLGGTGSANKLDDYEEGTWTATFYSGINGTGTNVGTKTGNYIKVGNMVTVSYAGAVLSGSPLCVHGLPFATTDDRLSGVTADGAVVYNSGSSTIINYRSGDGVYSRGTFTYFLT